MLCQPNGNFVALKPDQAALLSITKCLWGLNRTKVQAKKSIHPSIHPSATLSSSSWRNPRCSQASRDMEPTPWTSPSWTCHHLQGETSQRDPDQMLQTISTFQHRPLEELHFGRLCLRSVSFRPLTRTNDQRWRSVHTWTSKSGALLCSSAFSYWTTVQHNSYIATDGAPCPCPCPPPALGLMRMCCEWLKKKKKRMLSKKKIIIYVHSSTLVS